MALIPASTAAKTASATIATTTQTSPTDTLVSEFQYLFDTIQASVSNFGNLLAFNPSQITGTFVTGDTISQTTSGATGIVTGVQSGYLLYTPTSGTFDTTHLVKNSSNSASIIPVANGNQTNLVFDLSTLSKVSADITSVIEYLTNNGYQVTSNSTNYTIAWGTTGTVTTVGGSTITTVNPIAPPSLITALAPTSLSVISGTPVNIAFTPTGGVAPYNYHPGSGTIPNGLNFNVEGLLTGTPEVPSGTYSFTTDVVDSQGQTFSQLITIQATAPAITGITPTTIQGEVGIAFAATFYPVGGTGPFTFTTSGSVPSGLSFSSGTNVNTITLSGTPDTPGNDYSTLVIYVVDSLNQTYTQTISWTITRTTGYAVSTTNILGGVIIPAVSTSGITNSFGTIGLATASTTQLGAIKIDNATLQFNGSGQLAVPPTSTNILGGVIIPAVSTSGITNSFGTIGLATASTTQLGAIKIDNATLQFNGSGQLAVPPTSAMTVTSGAASLTVSASNGSYWKFIPNGNFTLNFTVPTTDGLVKQSVFILLSTNAYQLSSTQVNSNVATVKWLNGSVPSFGSNSFYKLEYTFLYTSGQLTVLGKWEIYQ